MAAVAGFGRVELVTKKKGSDRGQPYAMKTMKKANDGDQRKEVLLEKRVHERVRDCPFLVPLHYYFETETEFCFVIGEYPRK
jgi:ribosomal protein S6 kinase alpha-5